MFEVIMPYFFGILSGFIIYILSTNYSSMLNKRKEGKYIRYTFLKFLNLFIGNYKWYIQDAFKPKKEEKEIFLSRWNSSLDYIMILILDKKLVNYLNKNEEQLLDSFFLYAFALKSTLIEKNAKSIKTFLNLDTNIDDILKNCEVLVNLIKNDKI